MNEVKLSERVRPDVEAAPWVFTAIQKLERDYDALRAENERLERERAEQWKLRRDREAERDTNAAVAAELRAELAALKAVPDGVEVVGYLCNGGTRLLPASERMNAVWNAGRPLMTVAQHNAIVASLSAPAPGQDVGALVEKAYKEGWSMGWVTRHFDHKNAERVNPSLPPNNFANSDWDGSEARTCLAAHKAGGVQP